MRESVDPILFFDPDDPALREKLAALEPMPGYCVFIDIVGSTQMKDQGIEDWARAIYNALIANPRSFLPPSVWLLKCIGDELMCFIPKTLMDSGGATPLQLFAQLCSIAREPDPFFSKVKIAACYCTNAYPLTFLKGMPDVYGKDIDLTARLLSKAGEGELVMNEPFVQQVRADYVATDNKDQFQEVQLIVGPWPELLKGFSSYVKVYKLPAG